MRGLSRELISALRLSFEAWPDVGARLAACIAVPIGNLIRLAREADRAMLLSYERSLQPGPVGAGLLAGS